MASSTLSSQNAATNRLSDNVGRSRAVSSRVFIAGLILEASAVFLAHLGSAVGEQELSASPTTLPILIAEARFVGAAHYLADPILIFFVMYLVGRRTNLVRTYAGLSLALFFAGICGYYLGTVIGFVFYPINTGPFSQTPLFYLVVPLDEVLLTTGISVFLVGFSGLAFAHVSKASKARGASRENP